MRLLVLTATLLLSLPVLASDADKTDADAATRIDEVLGEELIQQAIEESAAEGNDCADRELLSCMGIDSDQCGTLLASVMRECTMPLARKILSSDTDMTADIELEHASCTFALGEKDYGIEPQRYLNCMPTGSFQNRTAIQEWLDEQK